MTTPTTFQGEPSEQTGIDWQDSAALIKLADAGGVLSALRTIRQGTLVELVQLVTSLPESEQAGYAIEKHGDHRLEYREILALSRRPDMPAA